MYPQILKLSRLVWQSQISLINHCSFRSLLIEKLLIVIRNVLHVPTDPEAEQVSMAVSNLINKPLLLQKSVD